MIKAGAIGEIAVTKQLLLEGYEVYKSVTENSIFDLLAYKDNTFFKVEVKSTSYKAKSGNWVVQIKSVRPNRTENRIIRFDKTKVDILGIYIESEDRVVLLPSNKVDNLNSITIPCKMS